MIFSFHRWKENSKRFVRSNDGVEVLDLNLELNS